MGPINDSEVLGECQQVLCAVGLRITCPSGRRFTCFILRLLLLLQLTFNAGISLVVMADGTDGTAGRRGAEPSGTLSVQTRGLNVALLGIGLQRLS